MRRKEVAVVLYGGIVQGVYLADGTGRELRCTYSVDLDGDDLAGLSDTDLIEHLEEAARIGLPDAVKALRDEVEQRDEYRRNAAKTGT